jgi:hypothetical protein
VIRTCAQVQQAIPLAYPLVEVDWEVECSGEGDDGLDAAVVGGAVYSLGEVGEREDVFC